MLVSDIEKKDKVEAFRKIFISNISHELKTPISLVRSYSQGLLDNITDEKGRTFYLNTIIEETERMAGIINELLLLSKYETDHITLEMTGFNLSELIGELLIRYDRKLGEKEIRPEVKIEPGQLIKADRAKLAVLLDNFISNALSYIDRKGELVFEVKGEKRKTFSIFNTGPAIPEDDLERIWSPFYKVDSSGSKKFGGTGLGLAIAAEILKKHHFDYGVCNKTGGVEFFFNFDRF